MLMFENVSEAQQHLVVIFVKTAKVFKLLLQSSVPHV